MKAPQLDPIGLGAPAPRPLRIEEAEKRDPILFAGDASAAREAETLREILSGPSASGSIFPEPVTWGEPDRLAGVNRALGELAESFQHFGNAATSASTALQELQGHMDKLQRSDRAAARRLWVAVAVAAAALFALWAFSGLR